MRFSSILIFVAFCLSATAAHAAVFIVTKTTDSLDGACAADCSLREAVVAANAAPGKSVIHLQAETYVLTLPAGRAWDGESFDEDENLNGDLDVTGTLKIIGQGRDVTVISGSQEAYDRLFDVLPGAKLTLEKLRLTGGHTTFYGGAIQNAGEAVLREVDVFDNEAVSRKYRGSGDRGFGGGIANFDSLEVHDSTLRDNNSDGRDIHAFIGGGGAIYNTANLKVRGSTISGNQANSSIFVDPDPWGVGGAIWNDGGTTSIGGSTFIANESPAAVITNSSGQMKIFNSTISGNLRTQAAVNNGLHPLPRHEPPPRQAFMQLVNVTIADNRTEGLVNNDVMLVRNSLIIGNGYDPFSGGYRDCKNNNHAEFTGLGVLLGSDSLGCTGEVIVPSANALSTVLYPLADNNGPTQTHALRPDSPALDAGLGSCAEIDQRGLRRPRDGNGDGLPGCDLGAYERAHP